MSGQIPRIPGEAGGGFSPEVSPYAGWQNKVLIDTYVETRGAMPGMGQELSRRLIEHAGVSVDPSLVPLIFDGTQVVSDGGQPLALVHYVDWAAGRLTRSHHHNPKALINTLNFLHLGRNTQEYIDARNGFIPMIEQALAWRPRR